MQIARDYFERALQIDAATLGATHPDVAGDCIAISEVLTLMGQLPAAQEYAQRAARIEAANNSSAA